MAGTHFSLDQLRTTYRVAEPDAALRVRQSDATQVTTAERGFGGRVVTFFKPDAARQPCDRREPAPGPAGDLRA